MTPDTKGKMNSFGVQLHAELNIDQLYCVYYNIQLTTKFVKEEFLVSCSLQALQAHSKVPGTCWSLAVINLSSLQEKSKLLGEYAKSLFLA
jgi:hypothetical protein